MKLTEAETLVVLQNILPIDLFTDMQYFELSLFFKMVIYIFLTLRSNCLHTFSRKFQCLKMNTIWQLAEA